MIFKDRQEAGTKLVLKLFEDEKILKNTNNVVIVSLLRGGAIIGDIISKRLEAKHLPLVVIKIPAPQNPELAIGALCFDVTYLEKNVVNSLGLSKPEIISLIATATAKFYAYVSKFAIKESLYPKSIKNKTVILTDDGIATGSTVKVAIAYLKTLYPKSIILTAPVAPYDFVATGINKEIILYKNHTFGAVSQFFEKFPQIEDEQVKKILTNR